tara:strand:+ start:405 stop:602 length:198 start_codon:yes stop_codon:yes gene_type:complete
MNKKILYVIYPLIGVLIAQLVFVYIKWEVNPFEWGLDTRAGACLSSLILGALGFLAASEAQDKKS